MLVFSDQQIKEILEQILERKDFEILPVGNHHLKRHLVYKVLLPQEKPLIFKLYYIPRRRSREMASLRLLENSGVKVPRILAQGLWEEQYEWLILEYLEGVLLDQVLCGLDEICKQRLFEEMGEELGKLHDYSSFDYIGEWDEEGRPLGQEESYYDYFVQSMERAITHIENQQLPDKVVLTKSIAELRGNYFCMQIDLVPRLVHRDFDGRNILVVQRNGRYSISGILDFEGSYPGNPEENFISLYYRYFMEDTKLEEAFWRGYTKHLPRPEGFEERLQTYLLAFAIGNCSWASQQAKDYYEDNIRLLKKLI